jgi:hypothetical protein
MMLPTPLPEKRVPPESPKDLRSDDEPAEWFTINEAQDLDPFLVSIVSEDDHWLFAASNGGLTAGRVSSELSLFPYYTQDKLIDLAPTTGPLTRIAWRDEAGQRRLWAPFDPRARGVSRTIAKRLDGSQLAFGEKEASAGLEFGYKWGFSRRFGFIRRASLRNVGREARAVEVLDGVQNLMPCGITADFQNEFSNLVDAYKRVEHVDGSRLRLVYLSSVPTDRAEPSESLRATTVWTCGLDASCGLLTSRQLGAFERGVAPTPERESRGRRAACLEVARFTLEPGQERHWYLVAEVGQSTSRVSRLAHFLAPREDASLAATLEDELARTSEGLCRKVATADGLQLTRDLRRTSRHFSNVMFNIMRGGVFLANGMIARSSFRAHLRHFNAAVAERCGAAVEALPERFTREQLEEWATRSGDEELERLACEYLPLTFSRRHGDPSRPWNKFSIHVSDAQGRPCFAYQGNWRDIFQNWEALMHSFPGYVEGAVYRFLNATTADGYNPYRVTDKGFDWETIDPDEPWSNIGYWGDHQIIYLLRLLEASRRFHPERLDGLLHRSIFAYARVPYRIRPYRAILEDPRTTIDYDLAAEHDIARRVESLGADGRLLTGADGEIVHVGLLEKLLVPLLAKLANFVPEGGIWMNTQRPEWNDANNALVGYGISVVTMAYCHRYLDFLLDWWGGRPPEETHKLSTAVLAWLEAQDAVFARSGTETPHDPRQRRAFLDALGESASVYRGRLYAEGLAGGRGEVALGRVCEFLTRARNWLAWSLRRNRRGDGLYHSYNLLRFEADGGVAVDALGEMLEGQVAILSAGLLAPAEALQVMQALRVSALFREDQGSYLLYPDRHLPFFLEKNRLEPGFVRATTLARALAEDPEQEIVEIDGEGALRFGGTLRNAQELRAALDALPPSWEAMRAAEGAALVEHFEEVFQHRAFTGRSGTFFAYEGLGSIYWHMVSKLVLAVQENVLVGATTPEQRATVAAMADFYVETLRGLGMEKEPRQYGAFPTDAYSHTPRHAGAQQPGMTGQVKEDILIRWGELGVAVRDGCLQFRPRLLAEREMLSEPGLFRHIDVEGAEQALLVPADAIAFTYCQVPVIYRIGSKPRLTLEDRDGEITALDGTRLDASRTRAILRRDGEIRRVQVEIPATWLRGAALGVF